VRGRLIGDEVEVLAAGSELGAGCIELLAAGLPAGELLSIRLAIPIASPRQV